MERIIVSFVSELRKSGIRVSPSESLDAVQALALAGMEGRRLVAPTPAPDTGEKCQ